MHQQSGLPAAIDVGTSAFGAGVATIAGARAAIVRKPFSAAADEESARYEAFVFAGVPAYFYRALEDEVWEGKI